MSYIQGPHWSHIECWNDSGAWFTTLIDSDGNPDYFSLGDHEHLADAWAAAKRHADRKGLPAHLVDEVCAVVETYIPKRPTQGEQDAD